MHFPCHLVILQPQTTVLTVCAITSNCMYDGLFLHFQIEVLFSEVWWQYQRRPFGIDYLSNAENECAPSQA